MELGIRGVIYFYIFMCIVLLVFNLLYIFRADRLERQQQHRREQWVRYLRAILGGYMTPRRQRKLFRRLRDVRELMAFHSAMQQEEADEAGTAAAFCNENHAMFLDLAREYQRRPATEQACFAYVVAEFYPPHGRQSNALVEQILRYLDGSTVYSRENVLCALYVLGNASAIEHAFIVMSQRGWYHDPRLLSDGLARYGGDKPALAARLWGRRRQLMECCQVGVVRFADALEGNGMVDTFLQALDGEPLPTETRFALVRYFRRHAVPQAKEMLLEMVKQDAGTGEALAIAATSVLSAYPGEESWAALMQAMHSPNWYVRQNAARALKELGASYEELQQALVGDRYATEMMEYVFGVQPSGGAAERKEAAATV